MRTLALSLSLAPACVWACIGSAASPGCGAKDATENRVVPIADAGGDAGDPICPDGPLVPCQAPTSGEVIVDIQPPCAIIYNGAEGRCVPTSRLPDQDHEKRCVNAAFWQQQARLFDTLSACAARCPERAEGGPSCDTLQ